MVPEVVLPSPTIPSNSQTEAREQAGGIVETWPAALAIAGLVVLRVLYAFHYRVDSDEPQHLHVVWGWAHGLLQYRDIFDNHSPLFQMLCAPIFRAFGEHPWIVVPMRLAMLPLYLADLAFVYLIARSLFPQRWAIWIALAAGTVPEFFLVTTEFRTDDLWTTLWLALVWQAVRGKLGGMRAFVFGLTLGACFSVSMKTSLLLLSMTIGAAGLVVLHTMSRRRGDALAMLKTCGLIVAGLIVIPGALVAFFAANGALHQMYYGVILHNNVPGLGKWGKTGFHLWLFPLSLPILLGLGWICMHSSADERKGAGRALILISVGAYYFLLRSYWPLVTAQDFVPILPLLAVTVLGFVYHLLSLTGLSQRILVPIAGVILVGAGMVWTCKDASPLDDEMAGFEQNLAIILHLTNPTDYVMDGKGETIFRPRPIYWVLEGVTLRRIALGSIPDDVRQRMIDTGTCIAVNHRLRVADQEWIQANFMEGDGKVWIAGKDLGSVRPLIDFMTEVKGRYSIVCSTGGVSGTLDGNPLQTSQEILPGEHDLKLKGSASSNAEVMLVWSQAVERGFNPFTKEIAGFSD